MPEQSFARVAASTKVVRLLHCEDVLFDSQDIVSRSSLTPVEVWVADGLGQSDLLRQSEAISPLAGCKYLMPCLRKLSKKRSSLETLVLHESARGYFPCRSLLEPRTELSQHVRVNHLILSGDVNWDGLSEVISPRRSITLRGGKDLLKSVSSWNSLDELVDAAGYGLTLNLVGGSDIDQFALRAWVFRVLNLQRRRNVDGREGFKEIVLYAPVSDEVKQTVAAIWMRLPGMFAHHVSFSICNDGSQRFEGWEQEKRCYEEADFSLAIGDSQQCVTVSTPLDSSKMVSVPPAHDELQQAWCLVDDSWLDDYDLCDDKRYLWR